MRFTVLERLECRRLVPYDPDYHGLLRREGRVEIKMADFQPATKQSPGEIKIKFSFKMQVIDQDTKQTMGLLEGEALTTLRDMALNKEILADGKPIRLPPNLRKVIEGAISDDIMLAASHVAHSMRLPSFLVLPIDLDALFDESALEGPKSKAAKATKKASKSA